LFFNYFKELCKEHF